MKKLGASAPWCDLSRYRRYGPKLEVEEERLLIALAQSGHDVAGWRLHQAFHGNILGLAGKHVPKGQTYLKKRPGYKKATLHTSELFEDLVAAGHLALWEAIRGFNLYGQLGTGDYTEQHVPVLIVAGLPPPPIITAVSVAGANLNLNGANGVTGEILVTLMSTNLTKPLSQWQSVATNVLGADGNFSITAANAVIPNVAQQFYVLQAH